MSRPPDRRAGVRGLCAVLLTLLLAALPALTPTPADAASRTTWERLAMCESSGNWSIDTGNGYYGGLQFWQPTWVDFGGRQYARKAHLATKAQQIEVAERVLAVQGWRAWPACSLRLGLRKPTKAERAAARKSAKKAAEKEARADAAKAGGKKKAGAKKAGPKKKAGSKKPGRTFYTVKAGDSLRSIAAAKRIPGGWPTLYRLNRSTLRSPHDIRPGQRIRIRGRRG